ncbi:MAG: thioredoxin domain-containing protein [Dehalococcoidales bacterium]|nr:thioredoxin domain-containing protein [Dehalococcoidales bacterium]
MNIRNRLAREKSPYLRQHADNPVDWFPWGDEAFTKAREENRPVFLSIGYSTCHWCHVMAHESFEDAEVARLINETFVSVKIDREERPDIDKVYMAVCQMMTGSGGWPLTIIMTPDKEPFFAGTYIPRKTRFGRIGMLELVPRVRELWTERRSEVLSSTGQIMAALQRETSGMPGPEPGEPVLRLAYQQLAGRFDGQHGGFGAAPKFPSPHHLLFLLRYWKRSGDGNALFMAEKTLRAMRFGGIYDHVGFGFHRYSTDARWLVPHFEKMLYDQALLATAYLEAYQATGREEYAETAREIFSYVLRDMQSPEGGFYSAEDADSEGEEGKFYLWTRDEMGKLLSAAEAELAVKVFNVTAEGNFADEASGVKTGNNILYLARSVEEMAAEAGMGLTDFQERIDGIRQKLFAGRNQRVHPDKDDKILTDWNGLMIAALAKGARILDAPQYAAAARRAADFILNRLRSPDGRLLHRYRDGEAAVEGNLDDHAFLVYAMLEMYETSFEVGYLRSALEINRGMVQHFRDAAGGGFYFTADDAEGLLIRQKEIYDGAVPSGNSMAMLNLIRLGRLTADADLERKSAEIGAAFAGTVAEMPSAHTQLMVAVDFAAGPSYEVIIVGDPQGDDTGEILRALNRSFIPNKVVMLRPIGESAGIDSIVPFIRNYSGIKGMATVYVCRNYQCQLPATDTASMLELLGASR